MPTVQKEARRVLWGRVQSKKGIMDAIEQSGPAVKGENQPDRMAVSNAGEIKPPMPGIKLPPIIWPPPPIVAQPPTEIRDWGINE
jgi:hypothetical protein